MMMMTEMQKKYDIGFSLTGFMEYVYCNLMTLIIFLLKLFPFSHDYSFRKCDICYQGELLCV